MKPELRYRDEADRAHGAIGAVIGVCAYDGEKYLVSVNIDNTAAEIMQLSEEFYLHGSPMFSVAASWRRLVSNYRLAVAMCAGNLLCRRMVGDRVYTPPEERRALRQAVVERCDECALEASEAEMLFENCYNHLEQIFDNHMVARTVSDMVHQLCSRREMSRHEIMEYLSGLM